MMAVLATTGGTVTVLALDGLIATGAFRPGYADDDLLIILAIGSDIGPPHRPGDPLRGRADGIHLLVVDTRTSRMTVVDVPRDGAIGGAKVNAHLAFGGPQRLEAVLEGWSGLPIDYWAVGSFRSIERIAEGLGGIEIDVEQRMRDRFSGSDLQPGPAVLGPGQALAFVRDRKSLPDGDIGRSRNHGRLMLAALQQIQRRDPDLLALAGYVRLFSANTVTNIPPTEVLPLALTALRLQPQDIEQVTVRGPFGSLGGQSILRLQPGTLFERLRAGHVGPTGG